MQNASEIIHLCTGIGDSIKLRGRQYIPQFRFLLLIRRADSHKAFDALLLEPNYRKFDPGLPGVRGRDEGTPQKYNKYSKYIKYIKY